MKRLILIILLLSVSQTALAQYLEEELVYELRLSYFGFIPDSIGGAGLSCKIQEDGGRVLEFYGYGTKGGVDIKNSAEVIIDKDDRIQKICHHSADLEETWEVDYSDSLIYHLADNKKEQTRDTLGMIENYPPVDALVALYLLRTIDIYEGYSSEIFILGHRAEDLQTTWKKVYLTVAKKKFEKVKGKKIECWKLIINLDVQDNLFPGDEITLYVTTKDLIPIKVISNFKPDEPLKKLLKIFVPTKIVAKLE